MKLTKATLKQLIQEELENTLQEDMADIHRKLEFDAKLAKERKALGRDVGTYQHKEAPAQEQSWSDWIYDVTSAPESTAYGTAPSDIQPFAGTEMGWGGPGTTAGFQTPDVYGEETEEALDTAKGAGAIAALATLGRAAPRPPTMGGTGPGGVIGSRVPPAGQHGSAPQWRHRTPSIQHGPPGSSMPGPWYQRISPTLRDWPVAPAWRPAPPGGWSSIPRLGESQQQNLQKIIQQELQTVLAETLSAEKQAKLKKLKKKKNKSKEEKEEEKSLKHQ